MTLRLVCLMFPICLQLLSLLAIETGAVGAAAPEPTARWRILSVQAHPDDEIVWSGSLARAKGELGENVRLTMVCAGAEGIRRQEMQCAAEALGIDDLRFLGLLPEDFTRMLGLSVGPGTRTRELWDAMRQRLVHLVFPLPPRPEAHPDSCPLTNLEKRLTGLIREVRPQVIITWEPGGTTIHPEHIIISHATTAAFFAAADPDYPGVENAPYAPQKLYYAGVHPLFRPDDTRMNSLIPFEREYIQNRIKTGFGMPPVTLVVDISRYMETKVKSALCHVSQNLPRTVENKSRSVLMGSGPNESKDLFYLAVPGAKGERGGEGSLFDGIGPGK